MFNYLFSLFHKLTIRSFAEVDRQKKRSVLERNFDLLINKWVTFRSGVLNLFYGRLGSTNDGKWSFSHESSRGISNEPSGEPSNGHQNDIKWMDHQYQKLSADKWSWNPVFDAGGIGKSNDCVAGNWTNQAFPEMPRQLGKLFNFLRSIKFWETAKSHNLSFNKLKLSLPNLTLS